MQFQAVTSQAVRNSLRDETGSTLGLVLLVSYRPLAHGRVPKVYSHGEHSAKGSLGSLSLGCDIDARSAGMAEAWLAKIEAFLTPRGRVDTA